MARTSDTDSITKISGRLRTDLRALGGAVDERRSEILDTVTNFTREQPYLATGLALGAGFVLAGGLFSRTTGRVLVFAGRHMFGKLLRQAVTTTLLTGALGAASNSSVKH